MVLDHGWFGVIENEELRFGSFRQFLLILADFGANFSHRFSHRNELRGEKKIERPVKVGSLAALKVDPRSRGKVLQVTRNGKLAVVKFEKCSRPTLHRVEGLLIISLSLQFPLVPQLHSGIVREF